MNEYKVISVRQPYASLLAAGIKPVENRSMKTNYRGPILIHAAKRWHINYDKETPFSILTTGQYNSAMESGTGLYSRSYFDELLFGAIIGKCELVDCVQYHDSAWAEPGSKWKWVLSNAKEIEPIPAKGQLGIWTYRTELTL